VTSGKGGVGKTTTSAAFSSGLALRGKKTAVIDFDVGLRNLDLIMGCERRVVYDFVNVIHGEANLTQALIKDKHCDNLFVLPASQTRDKDALTEEGVEKVLKDLADMGFDYIVCDSPAGIEHGAVMALTFADEAVIVTNPEVSSVRDSDRILGILQSKSRRARDGREPVKEHLVVTRYSPKRAVEGEMLSHVDVQEILRIPVLGVIPESEIVLQASNQGTPAIHMEGSDVAQAYEDVVARFLGEERPRPDRALGGCDAERRLEGEGDADLGGEGRQPIVTVGEQHRLAVVTGLEQLLGAAVHEADARVGLGDDDLVFRKRTRTPRWCWPWPRHGRFLRLRQSRMTAWVAGCGRIGMCRRRERDGWWSWFRISCFVLRA